MSKHFFFSFYFEHLPLKVWSVQTTCQSYACASRSTNQICNSLTKNFPLSDLYQSGIKKKRALGTRLNHSRVASCAKVNGEFGRRIILYMTQPLLTSSVPCQLRPKISLTFFFMLFFLYYFFSLVERWPERTFWYTLSHKFPWPWTGARSYRTLDQKTLQWQNIRPLSGIMMRNFNVPLGHVSASSIHRSRKI